MTIRLEAAAQHDREQVLGLFAAAISVDPGYQPPVTAGVVALSDWFDAKRPDWALLAYDESALLGHVSVRRNATLPGGASAPAGLEWELGRLVVAPAARRRGVASTLVDGAASVFGPRLWATCVEGGPSHALFAGFGWSAFSAVSFVGDPLAGVALRCPETAGSPVPFDDGCLLPPTT